MSILDEKTSRQIVQASKSVLDAREFHPAHSLAEHYNPLAMAPELIKVHDALCSEVNKAVKIPRKLTTVDSVKRFSRQLRGYDKQHLTLLISHPPTASIVCDTASTQCLRQSDKT